MYKSEADRDYDRAIAQAAAQQYGQMRTLSNMNTTAPRLTEVQKLIVEVCDEIRQMLVDKNRAYGNSFAEPAGIFAPGMSPMAHLDVRIDDKLQRIKCGDPGFNKEDTVKDLIGYLILKIVLKKKAEKEQRLDRPS